MDSRPVVPVSVIIPCFRCKETIGRAVRSVARQTFVPKELILVDDASGDATLAQLNELARLYKDGWIRVIALEHNLGAGEARNAGWQAATQEFVAFLDADDSWLDEKIEKQFGIMSSNRGLSLTGYTDRDQPTEVENNSEMMLVERVQVLARNPFWTSSVMLRRALSQRFRTGQRYAEDYLLWQEIVCSGAKAARLPFNMSVSYKPVFGESGLSAHLWRMEFGELGNYACLRRAGHIGWGAQLFFQLFSVVKFSRRLFIAVLRKRRVPT